MPQTKEITLYTYDELSESAKETAKAWWNECRDATDFEFVIDDFVRIVELMGFTPKTSEVRLMGGGTRQKPNVWWSLGYCQSDYAGFDGRYTYVKGSAQAVKDYAPKDEKLHAIADSLAEMQRRNFYKISAAFRFDDRRGYEITETLKDGDWMYGSDAEADAEETIREALKDLSHWLYWTLRKEDEYQSSDEQIAEIMEANGYTFRENGEREDA